MAVYTPGTEYTFHVAVVPGSPDVIHYFVMAAFDDGSADFARKCFQYLVPGGAFPFALATFTCTFQGIEDTLGIIDLVDSGWAFGAVAPATARVIGVALEFFDATRLFINVGQQSTGGFAVEADSRNNFVTFFDLARPGPGIVLYPVLPALRRRAGGQISHGDLFSTWCYVGPEGNLGHLFISNWICRTGRTP